MPTTNTRTTNTRNPPCIPPNNSQPPADSEILPHGDVSQGRLSNQSRAVSKRLLDLVIVIVGGLCLLPVLIVLAIAVKLTSPGSVFYSQIRLGRHGRKFRAWKFRSMIPKGDHILQQYLAEHPELIADWLKDHKLRNDPRVTPIGKMLRKTSLDELPQLWNVLVGEMSLVGPRPILEREIHKYGPSIDLYFTVKPGMTGLWQVSGRNNTTFEERVKFDQDYIRNWSVWLDLVILAKTVKTVVSAEGAY